MARTAGPVSGSTPLSTDQEYIESAKKLSPIKHRAKNVIFFVGDGMGVSTVTAARILEGQQMGKPGEEHSLFFEKLPYVALSKVYSWDQQTPDSAPTTTAMATGYKARESMLAVDHTTARYECDPEVIASKSLETILEQAAHAGKDTGVVTLVVP
ncbi:MAG: alkaline phosphatase [Gammaproteobacteria bacterium]